jgi:3',5'-cyclic-AMP phosphodiesterase
LFLRNSALGAAAALALLAGFSQAQNRKPASFHFVLIGDRTGETEPGVYERVFKEATALNPAFLLTAGDTIQGMRDLINDAEWDDVEKLIAPYRRFSLFLTPGNHDVWNDKSAEIYRKRSGHDLHYSFDYGTAHFTVLDNSRTEMDTPAELDFLTADLKAHAAQPVKFIISHKPTWAMSVMLDSPNFELHRIAKRFGVQYIVAGHVHGMMQSKLDGITYISLPSAGGNLRSTKRYEDGWFYGFLPVDVTPAGVTIRVQELAAPFGQGRTSPLAEWNKTRLLATQLR